MALHYQAVCDVHGPMKHRQSGGRWYWECLGFDGEGHEIRDLTDEAVSRIGEGLTRWPGVHVVSADL
jgi:hypothetical protein